MQKLLLTLLTFVMTVLSAHAQLKVSSDGNVSVGTTSSSASALSVNSVGDSLYAAFINGKMKVTNGYIDGSVFQPTTFPGFDTIAISQVVWDTFMDLHPVMHKRHVYSLSPLNPDPLRPQNVHFSISNMPYYFPQLSKINSDNDDLLNYAELVPLLVFVEQVTIRLVAHLHNLDISTVSRLMDCESEAEMQEVLESARESQSGSQENSPQARPTRQARRFADAVLYQNTPNPFTAQTEIRFRLPEDAKDAYICIFDMTGKTLKQIPVSGSQQSVTIQGYEFSAGMYLYSLIVNGQEIDTKRMILSK